MRMPSLAAAVTVLLLFGNQSPTYAAPIYFAVASSNAIDGQTLEQDADVDSQPSSDTAGPVQSQLADGSAIASSSVIDGVLRAFATSTSVAGAANGSAQFFDTLLIESATLALGTAVQLQADLLFSRTVTPNGIANPCTSGAVAFAGIDAGNSQGSAGSVFVQDGKCDNIDINNPSAFFTGFVGEELTISVFLTASATPFTTADASNTLRFFLTPVGEFSYTTASGNSYLREATAVPEPSSLFLIGSGISFAISRSRRRTARR